MSYDVGVFIGRFQPFHLAHLKEIQRTLTLAEHCIVVIGSYRSSPSPKNPFTAKEREDMISRSLDGDLDKIHFVYVRDYLYNDTQWFSDVTRLVSSKLDELGLTRDAKICLTGCNKDESSYYIGSLPDSWRREIIHVPHMKLNATDIREKLLAGKDPKKLKNIPIGTRMVLEDYVESPSFQATKEEFEFYQSYKAMFESLPYPPVFVTTDAVVIKNGHVLVVKRKMNPGKGKLALPGGHLDVDKPIIDSCLKELKEETKINVNKSFLRSLNPDQKFLIIPNPYEDEPLPMASALSSQTVGLS